MNQPGAEPLSADMLDKMQNLEDKIENKLKVIDKMFAVGVPSNPGTNSTAAATDMSNNNSNVQNNAAAPSSSPLVNSAMN